MVIARSVCKKRLRKFFWFPLQSFAGIFSNTQCLQLRHSTSFLRGSFRLRSTYLFPCSKMCHCCSNVTTLFLNVFCTFLKTTTVSNRIMGIVVRHHVSDIQKYSDISQCSYFEIFRENTRNLHKNDGYAVSLGPQLQHRRLVGVKLRSCSECDGNPEGTSESGNAMGFQHFTPRRSLHRATSGTYVLL